MDLKFLSLIVLIMLITFYFINEFKSLKSSIANSNENVNKLLKSKFNGFVNEVKDINTDLVNQTKKISKIHSQKITNMSNYFTESESEGKNVINYLSDTKNNDKMFKIEFNENDSKKNSVRNSTKDNVKTNDNDIVSKNSKLKTLSVTSEDDISDDDNSQDTIQEDARLSQKTSSSNDDVVSDRNDEREHEREHDTEEITEFAKYNDNNKNDELSEKSHSSINDSSKKQSDKRSHGHDESRSAKSSENGSNDIKIESVKLTTLNNKLNQDLNNDTISVESRDVKSLHDLISFGSKKSKGSKLKIEVGNNNDDKKSLDSAEIKNITTLEHVDKYSKKTLDNIARVLNVSNFYKDGTKRILYKKEELYLKIKEEINKKSNQ